MDPDTPPVFDRDQLFFVVRTILYATLDRIAWLLPSSIAMFELESQNPAGVVLDSILETCGMTLAELQFRLGDHVVGCETALGLCDEFGRACRSLYDFAWEHPELYLSGDLGATTAELYGPAWPDTDRHAAAFVDQILDRIEVRCASPS